MNRFTCPDVEHDAVCVLRNKCLLDGTSALVDTVPKQLPDMRHKDARHLVRMPEQGRGPEDRGQGGHQGRPDSESQVEEESECG